MIGGSYFSNITASMLLCCVSVYHVSVCVSSVLLRGSSCKKPLLDYVFHLLRLLSCSQLGNLPQVLRELCTQVVQVAFQSRHKEACTNRRYNLYLRCGEPELTACAFSSSCNGGSLLPRSGVCYSGLIMMALRTTHCYLLKEVGQHPVGYWPSTFLPLQFRLMRRE